MTVRQYDTVGEILRMFIKHSSLTDVELDAIIDYDIKHRMAQGAEGEGEE